MDCTSEQIDALKEIIGIGVGRGAKVLNSMLGSHVQLQVPTLQVLAPEEFFAEMRAFSNEPLSCVSLPFHGNASGMAELVFPSKTASRLIAALVPDDDDAADMDSIRAATLTEVGNIVLNAVMGTISNMLAFKFRYSLPNYTQAKANSLLPENVGCASMAILLANTHFSVRELEVDGNIVLFLEVASFSELLDAISMSAEA